MSRGRVYMVVALAIGTAACGSYPSSRVGRIPEETPNADHQGRLPPLGLTQAAMRGCETDYDCALTFLTDPETSCCGSTSCNGPRAYNRDFLRRLRRYRRRACQSRHPGGCVIRCFCEPRQYEAACLEGLCTAKSFWTR